MTVGPTVADAVKALRAAERRKLPVPEAVHTASAVRGAVFEIIQRPMPERPALPQDAAEVEAVIRAHAEEIRTLDVTQTAASRFQEEASQRYAQAVADAVPGWVKGMEKEFATLVGVVRAASDKLPEDLALIDPRRVNWTHPVHAAAYTKAEGAVVQLEQLVSDRADIVKVAGGDGGRDNALYAVAALPEPNVDTVMDGGWKRLAPIVRDWRELRQQPVARWVHLVRQERLTLRMATPGEVRERAATAALWRDAMWASHSGMNRAGAVANVAAVLRG